MDPHNLPKDKGMDVFDEDSDSGEEVITVHPIHIPKLTFQSQPYVNECWSYHSPEHNFHSKASSSSPTKEAPSERASSSTFPAIIPLNVGGHLYMTRLSTLLKFSDSMLAAMFSGRHKIDKDKDGNFFLDSNGIVFALILEYLRYGTIPKTDNMTFLLFREANYYGLHELVDRLQLKPEIATLAVKEAQRAQFPDYSLVKEEIIKVAMARATITRIGDVSIYAFRKDFKPKVATFNPKHGCIIESAQVSIGPWDAPADEESFIRCLEQDLAEEGYTLRPHEGKKKCKYYFGQTCQKCIFKITILFD